MASPTHHVSRRWAWWVALALTLAGVGAYSIVAALPGPTVPIDVLSAGGPAPSSNVSAFHALASSRPVLLDIPSIGVKTSVTELGLQADGEVEVPTTTANVGWYDKGPTPGQVGSAVILGHVDSYLGPGMLFYLKNVKAGNTLIVTLADGVTEHFKVDRVVEYAKTDFPDQLVYGKHGDARELQIVTCGGVFDEATGHYESNVVVFSHLSTASSSKTAA